jgi:hypothetical protein
MGAVARAARGIRGESHRTLGHVVGQRVKKVERLVLLSTLKGRSFLLGRAEVQVALQLASISVREPVKEPLGHNFARSGLFQPTLRKVVDVA